ncbi:zinc finger, C4 type [Cooperia oncophora]
MVIIFYRKHDNGKTSVEYVELFFPVDKAYGYRYKAITCWPCGSFFSRHALCPEKFKCPNNGQCVINVATRNSCRKCRLQKCFLVGMTPDGGISPNRDRGARILNETCRVCGDKAYGYRYKAITCWPCGSFFSRHALCPEKFKCPNNGQCVINVATRKSCRKCRLQKCFLALELSTTNRLG